MHIFILTIHFFLCFVLVGAILLQSGKGADIGAAFGAGGSQTLFGPRGAATLLSKVTAVVAILFLVTSIGLAKMARQGPGKSVFEKVPVEAPAAPQETAPVQPLTTPEGGK